jgi:hypothetical protein
MSVILSKRVTEEDVTAALNRIADVADPDDVNMVRAELARLRPPVLDAGEEDGVDYSVWTGKTDTSAWYSAGGVP